MDDDGDAARQRRNRNIALGVALGALAVLFFLMSIVKWGGHAGF
jgi:hypothetical protein